MTSLDFACLDGLFLFLMLFSLTERAGQSFLPRLSPDCVTPRHCVGAPRAWIFFFSLVLFAWATLSSSVCGCFTDLLGKFPPTDLPFLASSILLFATPVPPFFSHRRHPFFCRVGFFLLSPARLRPLPRFSLGKSLFHCPASFSRLKGLIPNFATICVFF